MYERVILIVLDSVGAGAADDAERFGDQGAHTLGHISSWCKDNGMNYSLPHMSRYGLGRLVKGYGIDSECELKGAFGVLKEISPGKDTSTGHWEMAGTPLEKEFPVFPDGFSQELLDQWIKDNDLPGVLGNCAASGTEIIKSLGEEHLATGKPIVYTSADSVFQVAWHEEKFGLEKLYEICESARKLLDPLGVGRVIARPFIGNNQDTFSRTENRRDFSMPPPYPNLLDVLVDQQYFVAGVGKIEDIFCHRAVTIVEHTGRNETSLDATIKVMDETQGKNGLIFTNLIDFDQLHGHRRNPKTYAEALMAFDAFLPNIEAHMSSGDLLLLTADHGNDPTYKGTDHTRENVPLLAYSSNPDFKPGELGTVRGFHSIARLTLDCLGLQDHVKTIPHLQDAPALVESLH